MGRTRFLLILDTVLFVAAVVLQAVALTGLTLHEWIGLAVALPLFLHLVLQWQWITATWRRATTDRRRRAQFNLLLNGLLFLFMTLAVVSGVLASRVVTPSLALAEGRLETWSQLHSLITNTLVVLVGLHVALNWRWIVSAIRLNVVRSWTTRGLIAPAEVLTTEPEDAG